MCFAFSCGSRIKGEQVSVVAGQGGRAIVPSTIRGGKIHQSMKSMQKKKSTKKAKAT